MSAVRPPSASPHPGLGFRAFVAMVAALMALNALAIDAMLPALPAIGAALNVATENDRQWVVTAYLLGFGAAQLVHGTLSDRYGRRPVLLAGLLLYVIFSFVATTATSFPMLIAARVMQGAAAAAGRVVAVSIVRDCYSGRMMARVMSLAFIVFLLVPILAPGIGQLVLLVAPWRWIFGLLGVFGAVVLLFAWWRLPETLDPANRRMIDPATILQGWRMVVNDRMSVGYTLALTLLSGALFGFINSVQQIMDDGFGKPQALPFVFGAIGVAMAIGSFLNSRIVQQLGSRRVSHAALIGFLLVIAVHLAVSISGHETSTSFTVLQSLTMFCFALCGPNFGAMAMERLGHVAGSAASVQGFVSTFGGALAGFLVSQQFDGSTTPVLLGFAIYGALSLVIVLVAERGRLFRPQVGDQRVEFH